MEFAWKSADNAQERAKDITLRKMQDESTVAAAALASDRENAANLANGLVSLATSDTATKVIGTAVSAGIDWIADLF